MDIEVTKIGERGQVVIPQHVRDEMDIHKGEKFIVLHKDDMIIMKRLVAPSKKEISEIFRKSRQHAHKQGLREKDMWQAVKKARGQR